MWSGPDIDHPGDRLVGWKNLCRYVTRGWGILDLATFNQALLEKWWWKFLIDPSWCSAKVVQFNYGLISWRTGPTLSGRISYFWKGVLSCLPAFRGCVLHEIKTGKETLFWKDCWLDGREPMYLWSDDFRGSLHPNDTVH